MARKERISQRNALVKVGTLKIKKETELNLPWRKRRWSTWGVKGKPKKSV